jgi:hypothetical protein
MYYTVSNTQQPMHTLMARLILSAMPALRTQVTIMVTHHHDDHGGHG